jgi:hypothetical protein
LYARDVYFGIPKLLIASSVARLRVASKLAHEVGHHVIATRGYIYQQSEIYKPWNGVLDPYEEKMADAYASHVIERMLRHWRYKIGKLMAGVLSTFLFKWGLEDYWDGNYQTAASLHFKAFIINRENEDAGQCYRHDMEKLKTQSPTPLSPAESEWLTQKYNPTPLSTGRLSLTKKYTLGRRDHRRARSSARSSKR